MLVKEIMTTAVRSVGPDTPMLEIGSIMCLYRISGLPVIDDEDTLVGFIAEKDVLHFLFPSIEEVMSGMGNVDPSSMPGKYKELANLTAKDLMATKVITASPEMPLLKATSLMVGNRFRRIPVAEGKRLVGMLSLGDVHKAIFHQYVSTKH
ncbi:MAG: CBS domain-containing protein [Chromatiales bacterium]|nr:CBS domain-containing protein [Chromatiales bacterium]